MEGIPPRTGFRLLVLTALLPCLLSLSFGGIRGSARETMPFGLSLWLLVATSFLALGWLGLLLQWLTIVRARGRGPFESVDSSAVMQISVTLGALTGAAVWPPLALRIATWAEPGRPPLEEMQLWLGLPGSFAGIYLTWRLLELARVLRGRGARPFAAAKALSLAIVLIFSAHPGF
jgi:hypothetical protein